ncbi:uncharacterized protein DUF3836 [Dysgonomonas alginatilytica]|uniref:Uncharacterized protein DUF3836 n=1 Tax=Dysgonomonas alginatilytica TaxID=1605892 RepID=A0A2V3PS86_9BACT|nr:DUF3836 domain-containing protein [Dysgonomonas alginatilytica]PXV67455.1 uncharacterized protein DUF3836 [Dysgonomonas alginatilytica]
MKTIIITLAISALALIANIENASGKESLYKNNEVNKQGQIVKTTVCKGEDDKNLILIKQYENKYDNNGNLRERVLSVWNSNQSKWNAIQKYQYEYSTNGQLQILSYTTFNESNEMWENEIKYAMYTYGSEGQLLTIDYLNIGDKGVLVSDFSSR